MPTLLYEKLEARRQRIYVERSEISMGERWMLMHAYILLLTFDNGCGRESSWGSGCEK
jgi:hypothetical protein